MKWAKLFPTTVGAILGILIALTPFNLFPVCEMKVETVAGTLMPMACFWTGKFAVTLGILIAIFSLLAYPTNDLMARRINSGYLAILGITTTLLGAGLIGGWCMNPIHPCRANTAPALTWLGAALLIVGVISIFVQRQEPR